MAQRAALRREEVIEPGEHGPGALQVARNAIFEDLAEHGVRLVREPGRVEREAVLPLVKALEEADACASDENAERIQHRKSTSPTGNPRYTLSNRSSTWFARHRRGRWKSGMRILAVPHVLQEGLDAEGAGFRPPFEPIVSHGDA